MRKPKAFGDDRGLPERGEVNQPKENFHNKTLLRHPVITLSSNQLYPCSLLARTVMSFIRNGNKHSPPQLGEGVVKIVVIGEPQVGKTRFIRAFYQHHEPGEIYSHNGVRVYPCEYLIDGTYGRAAIFEIPGTPDFFKELRMAHYANAKVIVLMYAIDEPLSLDLLTDKWLPETTDIIDSKGIPVMLVGNKIDLRDDPQVIERLALRKEAPVTYCQGADLLVNDQITDFYEVSTHNLEEVNEVFDSIFGFVQW